MLASRRVKRIYLNQLPLPQEPTLGQGVLHLVHAGKEETRRLAGSLVRKAEREISDLGQRQNVIELIEGLLLRRFSDLSREEIRAMILHDIRKSKAFQEVMEEIRTEGLEKGREEGREEGRLQVKQELVRKLVADGKSLKEIAELLDISLSQARKWAHSS